MTVKTIPAHWGGEKMARTLATDSNVRYARRDIYQMLRAVERIISQAFRRVNAYKNKFANGVDFAVWIV